MPSKKRPAASEGSSAQKSLRAEDLQLVACEGQDLDEKIENFRQSSECGSGTQAVDEFFKNLTTNERMSIWKKFESDRNTTRAKAKEVNDAFENLKGKGSMDQKRAMLKAWLKGGLKEAAIVASLEFENTTTKAEEEEWLPLHKAKSHYGESELKARLEAGDLLQFRGC